MVKSLSIIFMAVTLLISVGIPVVLTIYMYKKYKISIKAVFIGALMFFIFQGVIRIPVLSALQLTSWFRGVYSLYPVAVMFVIALTAALFETTGRYIGMKFILKDSLEWKNGVAYGIGHGGVEAILLVGMTYIANLIYSLLINTGLVNASGPINALVATRPDMFLAAGVERLFTMIFHIALSLIVLYGIMYKKRPFILLCILLHTLVDWIIPLIATNKADIWITEMFVAIIGILSFIFILKSKKMFEAAEKI